MSWDLERHKLGKQPVRIVDLHFKKCSLTYGNAPCTASGAAGTECYETRFTCQDVANFTSTNDIVSLNTPRAQQPIGSKIYPCLSERVDFSPTEIKPNKGLSIRSTIEVQANDFVHHDRGRDPYVATRPYDANKQGTFLGKQLARNPYFRGNIMVVRDGYIVDGVWDFANFKDRLFVIENISGPRISGGNRVYTITGKDLLDLGNAKRVKIPAPTDGKLNADIGPSATSLTLDSEATLTDYPTTGGIIMLRKEIMTYTTRSSQVISGLTRAQYGTKATDHRTGDTVQLCERIQGNIVDVIHKILTVNIGIDGDAYIPYDAGRTIPTGTNDEWDDEKDNWLNVQIDTIIPGPTGALKVLDSLCRDNQIDNWWDDEDQKIKLKANVPALGNEVIRTLTDAEDIVKGSLQIADVDDMRVSRILTKFDRIDFSDNNEESNYAIHNLYVKEELELPDTNGEKRLETIVSNFFTALNSTTVSQMQQRQVSRFGQTPKLLKFDLDARNADLKVGNLVDINTRDVAGKTGENEIYRYQLLYKKEIEPGSCYRYKALTFSFIDRNAFIGPSSLLSYDLESDANKKSNGFIGPNTGTFPDGGSLYLII